MGFRDGGRGQVREGGRDYVLGPRPGLVFHIGLGSRSGFMIRVRVGFQY